MLWLSESLPFPILPPPLLLTSAASWAGICQVSPGPSRDKRAFGCGHSAPTGPLRQCPAAGSRLRSRRREACPCCRCPCPPEFLQHHRIEWARHSFLALPLPSSHLGRVKLTSLCLSVFICKMGIIAVLASKGVFWVSIQCLNPHKAKVKPLSCV